MSDGGKKPLGDIQSLRERLGMLKQSGRSTLSGRMPTPDEAATQEPEVEHEPETVHEEQPSSMAEPSESIIDETVNYAESSEAAANYGEGDLELDSTVAGSPEGGLDGAEDFDQTWAGDESEALTAAVDDDDSTSSVLEETVQDGMEDSPRSSFDVFRRPSEPTPAPEPAVSVAPQPQDEPQAPSGFANPLHVGSYGPAVARIDLSAEDEAGLDDYEKKQRGLRPGLALGMTIGVGVLTLILGFFIGDMRNARRMINAQITSSARLQDNMADLFIQYDQLKPILLASDNQAVDWDKIKAIPKDLPRIDAGMLTYSPVPLNKELSRLLNSFVVDLSNLFQAVRTHRQLTLGRDKAELEALEQGTEFTKNKNFAVLYTPVKGRVQNLRYVPPEGRIVAVTGGPELNERKNDRVVPIKKRDGTTGKASLRNILLIKKTELAGSKSGDALTAYGKRVNALKEQLKALQQYESGFRETLKDQATRSQVFSF